MLLIKRFHSRGIDFLTFENFLCLKEKNHFSGKSHILFLAEKMVTSLERVFTKENSYVGLERHCYYYFFV